MELIDKESLIRAGQISKQVREEIPALVRKGKGMLQRHSQPHQHARTMELRDGFVEALAGADVLVLPEIYRVSGRTETDEISSRDLVADIQRAHPGKEVFYAADLTKATQMLRSLVLSGDVLLVQGAGDIDEVARNLVG